MDKTERCDRKLVFANGREFLGTGFGSSREALCECSFDTAMIGYQEIVSDPACAGEALVMTYPVIGSYGMADEDYEARDMPRRVPDCALLQRQALKFPLYQNAE